MAYASIGELRSLASLGDATDDATLLAHLDAASQAVDLFCGRTFTVPSSATSRRCKAVDRRALILPAGFDIASTTGLVVATDEDDDGTAETSWTITTDFELGPWSQVAPSGAPSAPWTEIHAVGSRLWPVTGWRPRVSVTARWGWPAVPPVVVEATLAIAHRRLVQDRNSPTGVAALGDFGPMVIRDRPDLLRRLSELARRPLVAV